MIEVDKKIEKIKKNCLETAKKENVALKQENDSICNQKVDEMINDYKDELSKKYSNDLNKIEREYNKNLFDFEMQERMKLNNIKKEVQNKITEEVMNELEKFTNSNEYENYLINNIDITLKNIQNHENATIFITEKDYKKYGEFIKNKYNLNIETMDNDNIGGIIIVDKFSKISIDNTMKNAIEEKIKNIKI